MLDVFFSAQYLGRELLRRIAQSRRCQPERLPRRGVRRTDTTSGNAGLFQVRWGEVSPPMDLQRPSHENAPGPTTGANERSPASAGFSIYWIRHSGGATSPRGRFQRPSANHIGPEVLYADLSKFSINVRLIVQHKCPLPSLRWYQMLVPEELLGFAASADSRRRCISFQAAVGGPWLEPPRRYSYTVVMRQGRWASSAMRGEVHPRGVGGRCRLWLEWRSRAS